MSLSISEQVDLVVEGTVYDYAVANGIISHGDPLRYALVLNLTRAEAAEELDRRGYPGIDMRISQFQRAVDGLGWEPSGTGYRIYFKERGIDSDISLHDSKGDFRKAWKDIYVRMYFNYGG